ncbi:hypothetical protein J2W69_003123 [Rheinheimera soli]|uniref:Secreted protein n=1 Tax=Rheinheimera soli TaxID=443616 RepID=A0ABU1W2H4_9GAMM|nr:hypothetical protein [Rheinheimera soli]
MLHVVKAFVCLGRSLIGFTALYWALYFGDLVIAFLLDTLRQLTFQSGHFLLNEKSNEAKVSNTISFHQKFRAR